MKKAIVMLVLMIAAACAAQQAAPAAQPQALPAIVGNTAPAVTAGKTAVVDLKKVFDALRETQDAKKKLEGDVDKEKQKLKNMQDDIQNLMEDYRQSKALWAPAKVQEKEQALVRKQQELSKALKEAEVKLQGREQEMTSGILDKILLAVKQVYDEGGYACVYDRKALLFGGEDVTGKVVEKMEKK